MCFFLESTVPKLEVYTGAFLLKLHIISPDFTNGREAPHESYARLLGTKTSCVIICYQVISRQYLYLYLYIYNLI
jgi:hypothetical protein